MKKYIDKFRNTILSGIIFFLPIFFLIGLIKIYGRALPDSVPKLPDLLS